MKANFYILAYHLDNYMPRGYVTSRTSVHFMNYHFVWCPKYRRPVLLGKIKDELEESIKESGEIGI